VTKEKPAKKKAKVDAAPKPKANDNYKSAETVDSDEDME
jgi:hypothetical protein